MLRSAERLTTPPIRNALLGERPMSDEISRDTPEGIRLKSVYGPARLALTTI